MVDVSIITGGIKSLANSAELVNYKEGPNYYLKEYNIDGEKWINYFEDDGTFCCRVPFFDSKNLRLIKKETPNEIVKYSRNGKEISRTVITPNGKMTTINGLDGFIKNGKAELSKGVTFNYLEMLGKVWKVSLHSMKPFQRFCHLLSRH